MERANRWPAGYTHKGKIPTGKRKYQISHLWNRHKEIIRLSINGVSGAAIARELGISPEAVSLCLNSKVAQDYMAELEEQRNKSACDISTRLRDMKGKALDVLEAGLDGEIDKVPVTPAMRIDIAKDLLDRAGHGKITKTANLDLHGTLGDDEMAKLREHALETAAQLRGSAAPIVEVQPTEEPTNETE